MDIEGSTFTTADLLSLRYPLGSGGTPCSTASLLLSSPWPISSTPSPPSSTSSSSPSINEGNLLSLSSSSPSSACSPPSSVPTATSPVPSELSFGTAGGGTAVIFTTTSSSPSPCAPSAPPPPAETGLALVDPVSTHGFEVAHAPAKSILCVHEQEHGDLIHFSTSPSNINSHQQQHNHVNGNGNEEDGGNRNINASSIMEADKDFITVQSSLLHGDNATANLPVSSSGNTDGNLFPTLILTSAGGCNDPIPMRLYASLTSPNNDNCPTSLNGSILTTTTGDGEDGPCILMTPISSHHQQLPHSSNDQFHHQILISSNGDENGEDDQNGGGATFTLSGFSHHDSSTNQDGSERTLGEMMEDCYEKNSQHGEITFAKLATSSTDAYSSHGKLKDILMNGNSHHHQQHQTHNQHHQHSVSLLSNSSTNGDTYMLRDLEETPSSSGTFFMPKEEDDNALVEELKLHSVDEQSSFNEAMNSIYNSGARNPFCDGSSPDGDLMMVADGQHHLSVSGYDGGAGVISAAGSPSGMLAIPPSSLSSSTSNGSGTPSVIWSNSGGIVSSMSSSIASQMMGGSNQYQSLILKEEDIGDLDGIEDDDLLEAKEEMEDYEEGDGHGGKGELKCKFCGFVCCSKSSLGIHERRHTGERPFACKYCGRLFNSAQCCKHHERLHTGDKPFQCSYCGKKYAVSTRLKRHERVHTREEPYKCTECNKTFRWFDAFRDHRNTHTGVPLYLCSVCGKTFTSYLKFYYHERGHLMKKERDRDRAAKQRLLNGGEGVGGEVGVGYNPWGNYISKEVIPICTTIDIMKSLQRNSSAGIISTLSQASCNNTPLPGKKSGAATGAKGNGSKKGAPKGKKGSQLQLQ